MTLARVEAQGDRLVVVNMNATRRGALSPDLYAAIAEAKDMATKGLFVGPSSGANMLAAAEIKKRNPEIKNILTFFSDRGEKYLSMMFP